MFLCIVVVGVTFAGIVTQRSHQQRTETQFVLYGQAVQFARAGLTEAVGWFRRQPSQPVTTFAPVLDAAAIPPVLDTIDPAIGLVREMEISNGVYGRFEVWKRWDADPDPTRLAWRQRMAARDVSAGRNAPTGTVWRLRAVAYVYRRQSAAVAYDRAPNQILATETIETEIRRMAMSLPGEAALCADNGVLVQIESGGQVNGTALGAGIVYPSGTGVPTITGTVTGTPAIAPIPGYDSRPERVFGMQSEQIRAAAHRAITASADLPVPVPDYQMIYFEGPELVLSAAKPLRGTGIIYAKGNVHFEGGNKSSFTGLLYVDGDLHIQDPMEFHGSVICTGEVRVDGGADFVTLTYDAAALDTLRHEMGPYRISGAIRRANTDD